MQSRGQVHPRAVHPPPPIRAVIVSRRLLMRDLLAQWVRGARGAEVVFEATDIDATVAEKCLGANILILDVPDCAHLAGVEVVRATAPAIRVLIVVAGQGDYIVHRAAAVGATGVVHHGDPLETFATAVTAVASGGVYHSPGVMQRCTAVPILKALTKRELAVLERACTGASDEEMAAELQCAVATVETHRRNCMTKLGTRDWGELLILGVRLGIVAVDRIPLGSSRRRTSRLRRPA